MRVYVGVDTAVKFTAAAAAAAVVAACSSSWDWARTCSAFVVSFLALVVRPESLSPRWLFCGRYLRENGDKIWQLSPPILRYFGAGVWMARASSRKIHRVK